MLRVSSQDAPSIDAERAVNMVVGPSKIATCVLLAGLALAACGSHGGDDPLSTPEWAESANGLCSAAIADMEAGSAEPIARGELLVDQLDELASTDPGVQSAVDAFRAALGSPETQADLTAMDAIGLQFDEIGADDCGLLFKSGL